MVQIIGLRDYFNQRTQRTDIKHAFFNLGITAETVENLLLEPEKYLEQIPEGDRWNIFFTVGHCKGEKPRDFESQDVIPFDIDQMDISKKDLVIDVVLKTLGLEYTKTGILCSGNGLQFFVKYRSFNSGFFAQKKHVYAAICKKINVALKEAGLEGKADPVVFSARRLMRMPGTENRKREKGLPDTQAYTIRGHIIEHPLWTLEGVLGVGDLGEKDQISTDFFKKRFPMPDTPTILEKCRFLAFCKNEPAKVSEPQWYASLSLLGHLENGKELAHEFSKGHPGYSPDMTDAKLEQALLASGPRTCSNIESLWEGCDGCEFYQSPTVKSPVMIRGENYIATKATGFYDILVGKNGSVKRSPNYNDILRYFESTHQYVVHSDSLRVYVFDGKIWKHMPEQEIKAFAEDNFDPKPTESLRMEFLNKVLVNNLRASAWFDESTKAKLSLENGVYDLHSKQLLPHSDEFFFTGIMPYAFDPGAEAPLFEKFLNDVTQNNSELKQVLLEFAGYAISGDDCWAQKAMIMPGEGSNGKSTFMEVLKALVGPDLYSTLQMSALDDDQKRAMLLNKLFNVGEETNIHSLNKSEAFKTLVSGGEVDVKVVFEKPFSYKNKAKLIFACNKMPYTTDNSKGLFRRLLIVPFNATFSHENGNIDVDIVEKLVAERPGILNMCIEAYRRLLRRKRFEEGPTVRKAIEAFIEENDMVAAFCTERINITGREVDAIDFDTMYKEFMEFSEFRGHRKFITYNEVRDKISRFVKEKGGEIKRIRAGENRRMHYLGVKFWSDF